METVKKYAPTVGIVLGTLAVVRLAANFGVDIFGWLPRRQPAAANGQGA